MARPCHELHIRMSPLTFCPAFVLTLTICSAMLPFWLWSPFRPGRAALLSRLFISRCSCSSPSRYTRTVTSGHCSPSRSCLQMRRKVSCSGPKLASLLSRVSSSPWSLRANMSLSIPRCDHLSFLPISHALTLCRTLRQILIQSRQLLACPCHFIHSSIL